MNEGAIRLASKMQQKWVSLPCYQKDVQTGFARRPHFKPRRKRVFILGTVKPAHLPISAPILPISGPISGNMTRYRVLMTRYRKTQYRDIPWYRSECCHDIGTDHNDPDDDDDDDLNCDWEMDDKNRLSDQVGQVQSKIDRAALHRHLIVGMELQKKDPRVSCYQKGQILYKQPAKAPDERRFWIFRKRRYYKYRVRYREEWNDIVSWWHDIGNRNIGTHPDTRISVPRCHDRRDCAPGPHPRPAAATCTHCTGPLSRHAPALWQFVVVAVRLGYFDARCSLYPSQHIKCCHLGAQAYGAAGGQGQACWIDIS